MAELNNKSKHGGQAGANAQAAEKRARMHEMIGYLDRGFNTNNIAAILGVSLSTAQGYRRELIRTARWKPRNFRLTDVRHEFLRANIHRSLEWFVEATGMAQSTLARDLKKLGRKDIKLTDEITGKSPLTGKNKKLELEFVECKKWNAIHKAMTTKQQVVL